MLYDVSVNLLAHALLANSDPDRIVGQLCGDFVRGSNLDAFPQAIQAGIRCHRAVDSYTDRHPLNLEARNLFEPEYRRYAGIVVDVIYDHFLANDWHKYNNAPLADYTALVTEALNARHSVLPQKLQNFAALLEVENTLERNRHRDHIELTLQRISGRRKFLKPVERVAPSMWSNEAALKQLFDRFFPELLDYTYKYQQHAVENQLGR